MVLHDDDEARRTFDNEACCVLITSRCSKELLSTEEQIAFIAVTSSLDCGNEGGVWQV